jgi:nucleotide-binding universal stress UspA family protein
MDDQNVRPRQGVVVGVDGSVSSRTALVFAYGDAARRAAALCVVAAYSPPEYTAIRLETSIGADLMDGGEITAEMRKMAQQMVDEVRAELVDELSPSMIDVTVVAGLAARTLIDLSAEAELFVVGSHGHGGFASMLLGSVSLQCALHARCPVTIVHPEKQAVSETQPAEQAGMDPIMAARCRDGEERRMIQQLDGPDGLLGVRPVGRLTAEDYATVIGACTRCSGRPRPAAAAAAQSRPRRLSDPASMPTTIAP